MGSFKLRFITRATLLPVEVEIDEISRNSDGTIHLTTPSLSRPNYTVEHDGSVTFEAARVDVTVFAHGHSPQLVWDP